MFPTVHGVVSQAGQGSGPPPAGGFWLWPTVPTGAAQAIARAGFVFTPTQALKVTRFRHGSNSPVSSNRITHLYAADTQHLLTTGAATHNALGWVEMNPDQEVILFAGRPYVIVGGHTGGSPTRTATVAKGDIDLDSRVTFVEPATSSSGSVQTFPSGGSSDTIVAAVDALLEAYSAPTGDGWAAPIEQIGARNDVAQGGWAFTPNVDVTLTKFRLANNGVGPTNYTVRVWRVSDQAVVASATFDATNLTEHTLGSPVNLDQGVQYIITAARNTNSIIRLYSDVATGLVVRGLVSFGGGRAAGSNSAFPGTTVSVWQGVDMWLEPR